MKVIFKSIYMNAFKERMEKLSKIASRLNVTPPTFTVVREFVRKVDYTRSIHYVEVEITGAAPKINGWTFATKFDHDTGIVSGKETPEGYTVDVCKCEHCGQNRFRKVTYLINGEHGEIKQVGGSCLKHYLGHVLPVNLSAYYDAINDINDSDNWGGGCVYHYNTRAVIALTVTFVKNRGYENGGVTKSRVINAMLDDQTDWEYVRNNVSESEIDAIMNEIKNLDDSSDYNRNLKILVNSECVEPNHVGYVCSMVPTAYREIAKRYEIEKSMKSEYISQVGDRLKNIELKVVKVFHSENQFGIKTMVQFVDGDGNIIVWWASKFIGESAIGCKFKVTGTVKSHDLYKGIKQTQLTRCKMEEVEVNV